MFALQAAGFAAAPVAGHLSDRMGRRSVMMTSMAMTAVVLVFMALAGKSVAFVVFVTILILKTGVLWRPGLRFLRRSWSLWIDT